MNILAMQSSGDQTSVSVMLDEEINSFSLTHARKDRPDWDMFLSNVGFKRDFDVKRVMESLIKESSYLWDWNLVVKLAKEKFLSAGSDAKAFDPNFANPTYSEDLNFKKLNE